MQKIHVYFMPGLAASSLIFERIELPEDTFEMHLLDWEMPIPNETLKEYAKRMASLVTHENAVLVGVSFGGVLVQEMAQFLKLRKVIIISSVKCNVEVPLRMKFAKSTKAYKLVPTGLMKNVEVLSKFSFGTAIQQRLKLYEKYLSMREKVYLDWAIEQMIMWERTEIDTKVVHIHGDMDEVFPIKNIQNCITIKGGTHIMILSKFKWLNENLPKIILE
ncbi:alpha/beta superfamily hydrolase [Flavobacterium arsenatis]|uniref:Alpha/beta superfamily hydrolase n=1 Tax=Flavobacterium arsenatis TaxID=1484332 RepID=A0ABU1TPS7_9FLAO|nr:acyl-CoA thioester hydrolase/BAAT C-terminal domain-containing protein [Flavobacterium arsenatis]MDR6967965.1 alpha/beta superfamily hydrolase [Flavobacterium arsenatis]